MADQTFKQALDADPTYGDIVNDNDVFGLQAPGQASGSQDKGITFRQIKTSFDKYSFSGARIITIGPDGEFLTIAAAVASLVDGVPTDHTIPATTVNIDRDGSGYGGGQYIVVNGLANLLGTEYLNYPRWIKPQNTGATLKYHLIARGMTGSDVNLSLYGGTGGVAAAESNLQYEVVSFPTVVFVLQSDVQHEITTDVTFPENWMFIIKPSESRANININGAGTLRFMDQGLVQICDTDIHIGVGDRAAITNKALTDYAEYGLAIELINTNIRLGPSSIGSGVYTAQVITVNATSIRWVGGFYAATPSPGTVVLGRMYAAEYIIDIAINSDQSFSNRYVSLEFGHYTGIHRPIVSKQVSVRSSTASSTLILACRDERDDSFFVVNDASFVSCFVQNAARIISKGLSQMVAFGGQIISHMEEGAIDCKMVAVTAIDDSAATFYTGLPFQNLIQSGRSAVAFYNNGAVALVPTAPIHLVQLINSSVTVTATPSLEPASFVQGQRLTVVVDDAGGATGNTLTLQDESILPGSLIKTKSGLTTPGQLVIAETEMVDFIFYNGYFCQIGDPVQFQSDINA